MDNKFELMVMNYMDKTWIAGSLLEIQLGNGNICVSAGTRKDKTECLGFSQINKTMKIGSIPKEKDVSDYNVIINIPNLESALVLKKVVDVIVNKLEQRK